MHFACLLKLWFFSWNEDFCDEYFLHYFCGYLIVYWKRSLLLLHIAFYITFIPLNILQTWCKKLTSWGFLYVFWVCWLLKVDVVVIWLQHRVLLFQKHGKHFPGFKVLLFIFFTMLFSILLLPTWSLRFLLSLKAATGLFWKVFFKGFVSRQYIPIFPHNFTDVW